MNINKDTYETKEVAGMTYTDYDGTQYFVIGKIRIKVSEHFSNNGKPFGCLLEDVIKHASLAI